MTADAVLRRQRPQGRQHHDRRHGRQACTGSSSTSAVPPSPPCELKKTDSGDTLRWQDITAFGADAVTVAGPERITDGGEDLGALLDKRNHVLGKRVLATSGDELGKVRDVDFDPATGYVLALLLEDGFVEGKRLIGIGSYAVVVQAVCSPVVRRV